MSERNTGATATDITRTLLSQVDNESFAILGLPLHSEHEQLKTFCDQLFGSDSDDSFHRLNKKLESVGIRRIVCVASFSDIKRRMPGKILVADKGTATIQSIETVLAKTGLVVTELESVIVISKSARESGTRTTEPSPDIAIIDLREAENAAAIRLAFSKSLPTALDSGLHVTIALGPDHRRVLHEFLPSIIQNAFLKSGSENQFPKVNVADFVNDLEGLSIVLGPDSQEKLGLKVRIDWANDASASAFSAFAPAAFNCFSASSDGPANEIFQKLAQLTISATAADKHVNILLVDKQGNDAIDVALDAAGIERDSMRMRNDLRGLALALHTHHDAYRHLPTIGSRTDDGKPLLSWRVHVLPFLDHQRALYEQFHLDEP